LKLVYRVLRKAYARSPFDGEGAYRYGGRWSSPGVRLSYTSEHQSLAMLEYFVHLDKDDPPSDLVLAVAEVAEDVTKESVNIGEIAANWRDGAAPPELTRFGDEFVLAGKSCVLFVPSVLAPHEKNCLINPAHAEFSRIVVRDLEPLAYDTRMFEKRTHRARKKS
jgi:RES domain-containing protein